MRKLHRKLRIRGLEERPKRSNGTNRQQPEMSEVESYEDSNDDDYVEYDSIIESTSYIESDSVSPVEEYQNYQQRIEEINVDIEALAREVEALLGFPLDVFLHIVSRLPVRSLAKCRCVCQTWRKILNDPIFIRLHHAKAIQHQTDSSTLVLPLSCYGRKPSNSVFFLEDEGEESMKIVERSFRPSSNFRASVVASCNGLLFLYDQVHHEAYVCNPITGEHLKIAEISKSKSRNSVFGFGYDQVVCEYKVIRLLFDSLDGFDTFKLEAEIYVLGSDVWREIGDVPYPLRATSPSVLLNGALHWLTDYNTDVAVSELIYSFDVNKEDFHPVPPPNGFSLNIEAFRFDLGELKRSLCLSYYSPMDWFEIWVMNEYGVKDSWARQYVISKQELGTQDLYLHPIKVLENGELLLEYSNVSLLCFDPKRRSLRELDDEKLPLTFDAITHVGSFVSPRDVIRPTTSRGDVGTRR